MSKEADPSLNPSSNPSFEEPCFDPDEFEKNEKERIEKKKVDDEKKVQKRKEEYNKAVYVTGIPENVKEEDFIRHFSKCGVLLKDEETRRPMAKIYRDDEGKPKGDGLVVYYVHNSVELAIDILDGADLYPGVPLTVKEAVYEKKRKGKGGGKGSKKQSKKIKKYDQQQELGWEEDDNCHVILTGMFTQEEAWTYPNFFEELKEDILKECEKIGPVKNIKIFERNPQGVVAVRFQEHPAASRCIDKMDGRFFAGQKLSAFFYDGYADYEVKETEEQREARIASFHDWLENQDK
eukprot:TRINITY_DN1589_c0_g1_i7.p1 TRINITY_DN1589_c0_g1~~TRINITY_DN1589_c0_g1_i7.p1  ORF type:complete len:293 (-),score=117.57 TRINITY_DN1589_c0_g1_i7:295-1173(-)